MQSYYRTLLLPLITGVFISGCSDLDQNIPAGIEDPKIVESEFGAIALARGVMATFSNAYVNYIAVTGVFTDELHETNANITSYVGAIVKTIDGRGVSNTGTGGYYAYLQSTRNSADQAIAMLELYGGDKHRHRLSELYSVKAYSLIFLAELFCSGIPLSTIDLGNDYTYTKGYSSSEIYGMASSIFDTAISLAGDSLPLQLLAKVGAARTMMNRGKYSEASVYLEGLTPSGDYVIHPHSNSRILSLSSVPFKEGGNGLDFRSSDPRIAYAFHEISRSSGDSTFRATKYLLSPASLQARSIAVASITEAKLMEAEISLSAGLNNWIDILNSIRTDGSFRVTHEGDTVWNRGTGGVENLPPLSRPTNHTGSVDLIFRERAFWLYLTGHRQGDMRRLIRQYEIDSELVYPTGFYGTNGASLAARYGDKVVFPVPQAEVDANPLYSGCFSEEA